MLRKFDFFAFKKFEERPLHLSNVWAQNDNRIYFLAYTLTFGRTAGAIGNEVTILAITVIPIYCCKDKSILTDFNNEYI